MGTNAGTSQRIKSKNEKSRFKSTAYKNCLAETKGDSVVEEKPVDSNGYKGFKGVHVVKTCGEIHKSRHNL